MTKISVCLNTLNEDKYLASCLASIKDFADEIVVVDMNSEDDSVKIARKFGAKVYEHERLSYVEPARNFAIKKATGDWILLLDPDEEIGKNLVNELKRISTDKSADYVRIPRKNIIFDKWMEYSRWWPDYNIRFFKKKNVNWSDEIHSIPITTGRGIDLEAKEDNAIIHHHYQTVEQYIERLNRYTTVQAKNRVREGYAFNWRDVIQKPMSEFLSRYFAGAGYKDGFHGLALSFLQSFSELVVYLKVWQLTKFKETKPPVSEVLSEFKDVASELHYWQADTLLKEVGGLKHRIKRKFRLP
jgi:glycosyltransferase involved in cell wall biosynthesis